MKIQETTQSISKKIQKIILSQLYDKMKVVAPKIQTDIRNVNLRLWKASDTYQSLLYGQLTHELGFPKGEARKMVDAVLNKIADSLIVLPKLPKIDTNGVVRVMSFKIVTKSLPGVKDLPESEIVTNKKASNDISDDFGSFGAEAIRKTLPWVEWLLFRGNSYIIFNYEYVNVTSIGDSHSRSGRGLMIRDESENWKVPSEFSGTKESNWITRELTDNIEFLENQYARVIKKHMAKI